MAQENSFDIVSKVDMQEVRNAIDQALKEIHQRFDLKDSHSEVTHGRQRCDSACLGRGVPSGGGEGHFGAEAGEAGRFAEEHDLWQAGGGVGQERAAEDILATRHPRRKGQGDRSPGEGLEEEGAGQHPGRHGENFKQGPRRAAGDYCHAAGKEMGLELQFTNYRSN